MNTDIAHLSILALCILLSSVVVLADQKPSEEQPKIELITTLEAKGRYISLQGSRLFLMSDVKAKRSGYWFDIETDPAAPMLVCDKLPSGWDAAVAGKHAFVCDYTTSLKVYEIKEQQWNLAGTLALPSQTENIIIRNNLAYVANHRAGLTIVDISTPAKPALVSNLNPKIDCDAIGLWQDCAVLYGHWESRLVFVDISDPAKPQQLGVYQHDAKTFGQGEIQVNNGLAYCTSRRGVVIVSLTDPTNPKLVKVADPQGVRDVKVQNEYAFVSFNKGITVLNISDPTNPVNIVRFKCNVRELSVNHVATDYYIYAAGEDGLLVLRFCPSQKKTD